MQPEFAAALLRCPVCGHERTLTLLAECSDEREVREGTLRCGACATEFSVQRGVADLLHGAPEHVLREADGLERFAEYMKSQGWDRDRIRNLPNEQGDGYWYTQARSMEQVLRTVDFRPGEWLLDVGSNTCWAANHFATRGLRVIALDITTTEMQGLYTSDYFIEDGTSYFERVLASMNDIPLASESLDYIYCCETLHHNDPAGLRRTFEEAFRVLKPGGKLLVVNETLKAIRDPVGVHADAVEQFEGYEHAYWAWHYRWEAIRAGFTTKILEPRYWWPFDQTKVELPVGTPPLRAFARRTGFRLLTSRLGRRAYVLWLNHVAGTVQLTMIASKPVRPRLRRWLTGSRPRMARCG